MDEVKEHNGAFEQSEDPTYLIELDGTKEECTTCTKRLECISKEASVCKDVADEIMNRLAYEEQMRQEEEAEQQRRWEYEQREEEDRQERKRKEREAEEARYMEEAEERRRKRKLEEQESWDRLTGRRYRWHY